MICLHFTVFTIVLLGNRLLLSYFGRENLKLFQLSSTTVSFGKPDDDFYTATNYLSWYVQQSLSFYSAELNIKCNKIQLFKF